MKLLRNLRRQIRTFSGHPAVRMVDLPLAPEPELLMRKAIEVASQAPRYGDVPVGAVLWTGGRIVATAFNRREYSQSALGHAELDLVLAFNREVESWRLPPDSVIAVTAEPCLMCTGALLQARVSKVIYGCKDTKNAGLRLVEEKIKAGVFDHCFEIVAGTLESECAGLLSQFFRQRRAEQKNTGK